MFFSGGHMPRYETPESITSYALKAGLRTDNIYVFRDTSAFKAAIQSIGKLPDIDFYDRHGFKMKVKNPDDCHKTVDKIIDSLSLQQPYPLDSTSRLSDLTSELCNLDGSPWNMDQSIAADFTVAIYWATFTGNTNKKSPRVWEEKLYEKGKTLGIRILKVNFDFQEFWESD